MTTNTRERVVVDGKVPCMNPRGSMGGIDQSKIIYPTNEEREKANVTRTIVLDLGAEIRRLEKIKRKMVESCTHEIFYDEPGYMYDERYCWVCGKSLGSM